MADQGINSQPRVPEKFGDEIGGRGRVYFENVVIDNVLDALLELSATVYAHRDRVSVLEKVLEERGIAVSDAIEAHVPSEAELAMLSILRRSERYGSWYDRRAAPPNQAGR